MIYTQRDAKQFFVEKVIAQARVDHVPLSLAEDYEQKIQCLLRRAFAADLTVDTAQGGLPHDDVPQHVQIVGSRGCRSGRP